MRYLVDANVLIQAKNVHYGMDFCLGFWSWLQDANAAGTVYSVAKIGEELAGHKDELAQWASEQGKGFFLEPDGLVTSALAEVARWAASAAYRPEAIAEFLESGDMYLIAHALAYEHTVVTHEKGQLTVKKIKIPDACAGVAVATASTLNCIGPFAMLRSEQARFVLPMPPAGPIATLPASSTVSDSSAAPIVIPPA